MRIEYRPLTKNRCYKRAKKMVPKGIMVHSTATPGVMAERFLQLWNVAEPGGRQVCVHAFLDDTGVYQTLPWTMAGWHAGGSANDSFIGFEICEPKQLEDAGYFSTVWGYAVELCAQLCRMYGLTEKDILCHSEGYKKGIASNHADVMHWFPLHGRNMDNFRAAVKFALDKKEVKEVRYNKLEELPGWARPTICKLVEKGWLAGDGEKLDLSPDMVRLLVIQDRAGLFGP